MNETADDILDMLDELVDDFRYVIDKYLDIVEDFDIDTMEETDKIRHIREKYFEE